jgi:hypothetical protein
VTRRIRIGSLLVVAALAAACDERLSEFTGPTPDLRPTFSSIQQDIFDAPDASGRAACTSCHNRVLARFNGGLDLSSAVSYNNMVNAPSTDKRGAIRVIPGDPANSYLIHKLEGRGDIVGVRMPVSGPYLTQGQIAIIRRWIELGARND